VLAPSEQRQLSTQLMNWVRFEREEVSFIHDDEEFIYSFRFDSGKVTFKRLQPAAKFQETEVVLHPAGEKAIASTAVIVLYKALGSGITLGGFLPDTLRTIMKLYPSKEALVANLNRSIQFFPAKTAIASVDAVIKFITPYAPWTVSPSSRWTDKLKGTQSEPISLDDVPDCAPKDTTPVKPQPASPRPPVTPSPQKTPDAIRPNPVQAATPSTPAPLSQSKAVIGSQLQDVLKQPASKKRALEPDGKVVGAAKKKAISPRPPPKPSPKPSTAVKKGSPSAKLPPMPTVSPSSKTPKIPSTLDFLKGPVIPTLTLKPPANLQRSITKMSDAANLIANIVPPMSPKAGTPSSKPTIVSQQNLGLFPYSTSPPLTNKNLAVPPAFPLKPLPPLKNPIKAPASAKGVRSNTSSPVPPPPKTRTSSPHSQKRTTDTTSGPVSHVVKLHIEKTELKELMAVRSKNATSDVIVTPGKKGNNIEGETSEKTSTSQMDAQTKSGALSKQTKDSSKQRPTVIDVDDLTEASSPMSKTPAQNDAKTKLVIKMSTRLSPQDQTFLSKEQQRTELASTSSATNGTTEMNGVSNDAQSTPKASTKREESPKTQSASKSPVLKRITQVLPPTPESVYTSIRVSSATSPLNGSSSTQPATPPQSDVSASRSVSPILLRPPIPTVPVSGPPLSPPTLPKTIMISISPPHPDCPILPTSVDLTMNGSVQGDSPKSISVSSSTISNGYHTGADTSPDISMQIGKELASSTSIVQRAPLNISIGRDRSFSLGTRNFLAERRKIEEAQTKERELAYQSHIEALESEIWRLEEKLSGSREDMTHMEERCAKAERDSKDTNERYLAASKDLDAVSKKADSLLERVTELERERDKAIQDLDNAYVVHDRALDVAQEEFKKKEADLNNLVEERTKERDEMAKCLVGIQSLAKLPSFGSGK
jgi:hypothetical protein